MPMKLENYSRNQKKRKEYIHQSRLLLAVVYVGKAKHDACIGALEKACSGAGSGSGAQDTGFKRLHSH